MMPVEFRRLLRFLSAMACGGTLAFACSEAAAGDEVPPDVKQAVTFIFQADSKGGVARDAKGNPMPIGTGFHVTAPAPGNPNALYGYLVTAGHVLRDGSGKLLPSVFVRLNTKKGDSQLLQLQASMNGQKTIYMHPDPDVDIAVVPEMPFDQNTYDLKYVPDSMVLTKESFKASGISEGTDIFFAGLFAHHFGNSKNLPIFRFGRVAMISDEPIPWQDPWEREPRPRDLFLMETSSFGGNSGSPVFFVQNGRLTLAGVMKGAFNEPRPLGVTSGQVV